MHPSDGRTTTGSYQVSRNSGWWSETKHSSCSGLWRGSTEAAGALLLSHSTPPPSRPTQLPPCPAALMLPRLQSHRCLLQCRLSAERGCWARRRGQPARAGQWVTSWEQGHLPKEKAGSEWPTLTSALVLNGASSDIFTMRSRIFHSFRQAFLISCIFSPLILNSNC